MTSVYRSCLCPIIQALMELILLFMSIQLSLATPPHIIFILVDDLGWNDVSFHGSNEIPTPNIDALAADGMVLNNYYVSPICTPSRGAFFTGIDPIHLGLQHDVLYSSEPWGLPLNFLTFPHHMKQLGYATHLVGKWHLGFFKKEYTPTFRGFDSHFGYWTGAEDYYTHTNMQFGVAGLDLRNNLTLVKSELGHYATHLYTRKAIEILKTHNKSQPLFLVVSHMAVHVADGYQKFQAPQNYIKKFNHIADIRRRKFAAMVSVLDDSIGRLVTELDYRGMLENSIIAFSTDNGGAAGGIDGGVGSNWPLRGTKYTLWEGGIRGNGFIWTPLLPKTRGTISNHLMHITDWLPTLHEAAGGDLCALGKIDGLSLWRSFKNNFPSPRTEVLHNIDQKWHVAALRQGNFKFVSGSVFNGMFDGWYMPLGNVNKFNVFTYLKQLQKSPVGKALSKRIKQDNYLNGSSWFLPSHLISVGSSFNSLMLKTEMENIMTMVKKWRYKLTVNCNQNLNETVECIPSRAPCLFNIQEDPCEYINLAKVQPQILEKLKIRLQQYQATCVPTVNLPSDPRGNPKFHSYSWVPWKDQL